MIHKKTYKNIVIISLIFIIMLFLSIRINLSIDESFTMSLIKNSYINIIKLDSLDVHPPLYYLCLKLFISCFSFFTNNAIVKIILARIFSILCLLLSFITICKILNYISIKYNSVILFAVIVGLSLFTNQTSDIRMYSLSALFITIEFLNIVKYYVCNKKLKYIFLATIFGILAAYTHDFSAVIAALLILILFIYSVFNKKQKDAVAFLLSGMFFVIFYLPWAFVAIYQLKNLPNNNWISSSQVIKYSMEFIVIILLMLIPIFYLRKYINKNVYTCFRLLNYAVFIILIFELVLSFYTPMFQIRFVYPLLILYVGVSYGILTQLFHIDHINMYHGYCKKIIILFLLLLGLQAGISNLKLQVSGYRISSELINFSNNKRNRINIYKMTNAYTHPDDLYQFYTYAQYENRHLSNRDNKMIAYSKLSNEAARGTNPHLRFLIWNTGRN